MRLKNRRPQLHPSCASALGDGRALILVCSLLAFSCGAKTGLEIDDFDAPPVFDAGVDAPTDSGPCSIERIPIQPARGDVVWVLDRSGSMRLGFDGSENLPRPFWRWTILRQAMASLLPLLGERMRSGAKIYPNPPPPDAVEITAEVACQTSPQLDVPIALNSASTILRAIDAHDPFGGTPTVEAILVAREALRNSREGRRFIVVATDGGPNCNPRLRVDPRRCVCTNVPEACQHPTEGIYSCLDDPRTLEVLRETHETWGIPVFIIGIPDESRPDLIDFLDRMAVAGGRPRNVPGQRRFFSASNEEELREVLREVIEAIGRCAFTLERAVEEDVVVEIRLNDQVLVEDPVNGWMWSESSRQEIELTGPACERANRQGSRLEAWIQRCRD
ncbi:MAG: vWA domain-containing protein [Sandaracinaceae bacterium]|nr:vWA domain-containing protein [Sandaracinaceae bacterium]